MIKRSANKEGVVTFNISFQGLPTNKGLSRLETGNTSLRLNDQSQGSFLSVRSNPLTPLTFDDRFRALRYESRSISSDVDVDEIHPSEESGNKHSQNGTGHDDNKGIGEDFLTQEPIDFEELQRITRIDKDDEDRSSASTISKSSKKITKPPVGFVYKESRFKEEARNKGKRQAWQPHEDEQVLELVAKHGQSWALIASMMEGRTGKQIRDRYLNKLRPDIKNEEWTREEDRRLISLYRQIGRKWSKIATYIPGRTEGQVKNRFYSHIKKRLLPKEASENASRSPEGEDSPTCGSNKNFQAERSLSHDIYPNSGYQADNNFFPLTDCNNFDQAASLELKLDFPFQEDLFESSFQPLDSFQNAEQGYSFKSPDPTDVISYSEASDIKPKSISPEKYPRRTEGFPFPRTAESYPKYVNQSVFSAEHGTNSYVGSKHDVYNLKDLAQDFKIRCNTSSHGRETEMINIEHGYHNGSTLTGRGQKPDQLYNTELNFPAYSDKRMSSFRTIPSTAIQGMNMMKPLNQNYTNGGVNINML